MREKDALIDLDAVLVALQKFCFGRDLRGGRGQTRHSRGRGKYQIFQTNELRAVAGQFVVKRLRMHGEKTLTLLAGGTENKLRRGCLRAVALWFLRPGAAQGRC